MKGRAETGEEGEQKPAKKQIPPQKEKKQKPEKKEIRVQKEEEKDIQGIAET